jgi:uncharacterized membrane protein
LENTVFGFNEAQISDFFSTYGIIGLILFMLFIIGHLAWESKAGKIGTFALFAALALGIVSFVAKYIIQWVLGIN